MVTVVQTAYAYTAYSETTLDPAFSSAITSGNTVLVAVIGLFGTTITSATFDSTSMTEDLKTNTDTVAFYRLSNITTGGTVAAVTKTNGSAIAWAIEVSGLDNTGQPDETNAWAATTEGFGTSHSEAVTPSEADCFVFALAGASTSSTTWTGSGSAVAAQAADDDQRGIIYEDGVSITSDTVAWTTSGGNSFDVASVVYGAAAAGAIITGTGAAAADDGAASGTAERELTGSGTPQAQAGTTSAAAERVLTCSGTLVAGSASTAGAATLQLKLLLTAAVGRELRDEEGALVSSLAGIIYEWYDKDTDTNGNPDFSGTFNTDANGEATIQLPGTALTAGQYGLLVLVHPSDNTIRGVYRIPVS